MYARQPRRHTGSMRSPHLKRRLNDHNQLASENLECSVPNDRWPIKEKVWNQCVRGALSVLQVGDKVEDRVLNLLRGSPTLEGI